MWLNKRNTIRELALTIFFSISAKDFNLCCLFSKQPTWRLYPTASVPITRFFTYKEKASLYCLTASIPTSFSLLKILMRANIDPNFLLQIIQQLLQFSDAKDRGHGWLQSFQMEFFIISRFPRSTHLTTKKKSWFTKHPNCPWKLKNKF